MWFAPAGDKRGKLSVSGLRYSPNKADRDILYGELNAVNPIVDFATKGITIYGQKTLQRETTALNRVNVRMTVNEIKKRVKVKMDELLFEANTPSVWTKAKASVDAILEPIRLAGGLETYKTVFDATINTADVVQQNIMKGIIRIVPVNTIEEIEINMFVDPSGTTFTE
jgi:phage tail sheath protein FI